MLKISIFDNELENRYVKITATSFSDQLFHQIVWLPIVFLLYIILRSWWRQVTTSFDNVLLPNMQPGLILGLCPANERRRYKVTPSLIGWAQTWNQPCATHLHPSLRRSRYPCYLTPKFVIMPKIVNMDRWTFKPHLIIYILCTWSIRSTTTRLWKGCHQHVDVVMNLDTTLTISFELSSLNGRKSLKNIHVHINDIYISIILLW